MTKVRGGIFVVNELANVQPQLVALRLHVLLVNMGYSLVMVSRTTSLTASKLTPKRYSHSDRNYFSGILHRRLSHPASFSRFVRSISCDCSSRWCNACSTCSPARGFCCLVRSIGVLVLPCRIAHRTSSGVCERHNRPWAICSQRAPSDSQQLCCRYEPNSASIKLHLQRCSCGGY